MDIGNQIRVITTEPAEMPEKREVPAPVPAEVRQQKEVAAAK